MNRPEIEDVIRRALTEDLAAAGDITTQATVAEHIQARARIVARAAGTVAGLDVARQVFHTIEATIEWTPHVTDGTAVPAGSVLAELQGPARPILTGERTALNLLAHLSGIATATADLVHRVAGTGARSVGHMVQIEVEVDTLDQLEQLLRAGADAVLLDNMDPDTLRAAVGRIDGHMIAEASGNTTADTVREVAESGVDYISAGWNHPLGTKSQRHGARVHRHAGPSNGYLRKGVRQARYPVAQAAPRGAASREQTATRSWHTSWAFDTVSPLSFTQPRNRFSPDQGAPRARQGSSCAMVISPHKGMRRTMRKQLRVWRRISTSSACDKRSRHIVTTQIQGYGSC